MVFFMKSVGLFYNRFTGAKIVYPDKNKKIRYKPPDKHQRIILIIFAILFVNRFFDAGRGNFTV